MDAVTDEEIAAALRGAPRWITTASVRDTLKTWQPRNADRLNAEDAVEMLLRVGALGEVLLKLSEGKPR